MLHKLNSVCMQGNEGCMSGIRCSEAVMREACTLSSGMNVSSETECVSRAVDVLAQWK